MEDPDGPGERGQEAETDLYCGGSAESRIPVVCSQLTGKPLVPADASERSP